MERRRDLTIPSRESELLEIIRQKDKSITFLKDRIALAQNKTGTTSRASLVPGFHSSTLDPDAQSFLEQKSKTIIEQEKIIAALQSELDRLSESRLMPNSDFDERERMLVRSLSAKDAVIESQKVRMSVLEGELTIVSRQLARSREESRVMNVRERNNGGSNSTSTPLAAAAATITEASTQHDSSVGTTFYSPQLLEVTAVDDFCSGDEIPEEIVFETIACDVVVVVPPVAEEVLCSAGTCKEVEEEQVEEDQQVEEEEDQQVEEEEDQQVEEEEDQQVVEEPVLSLIPSAAVTATSLGNISSSNESKNRSGETLRKSRSSSRTFAVKGSLEHWLDDEGHSDEDQIIKDPPVCTEKRLATDSCSSVAPLTLPAGRRLTTTAWDEEVQQIAHHHHYQNPAPTPYEEDNRVSAKGSSSNDVSAPPAPYVNMEEMPIRSLHSTTVNLLHLRKADTGEACSYGFDRSYSQQSSFCNSTLSGLGEEAHTSAALLRARSTTRRLKKGEGTGGGLLNNNAHRQSTKVLTSSEASRPKKKRPKKPSSAIVVTSTMNLRNRSLQTAAKIVATPLPLSLRTEVDYKHYQDDFEDDFEVKKSLNSSVAIEQDEELRLPPPLLPTIILSTSDHFGCKNDSSKLVTMSPYVLAPPPPREQRECLRNKYIQRRNQKKLLSKETSTVHLESRVESLSQQMMMTGSPQPSIATITEESIIIMNNNPPETPVNSRCVSTNLDEIDKKLQVSMVKLPCGGEVVAWDILQRKGKKGVYSFVENPQKSIVLSCKNGKVMARGGGGEFVPIGSFLEKTLRNE